MARRGGSGAGALLLFGVAAIAAMCRGSGGSAVEAHPSPMRRIRLLSTLCVAPAQRACAAQPPAVSGWRLSLLGRPGVHRAARGRYCIASGGNKRYGV